MAEIVAEAQRPAGEPESGAVIYWTRVLADADHERPLLALDRALNCPTDDRMRDYAIGGAGVLGLQVRSDGAPVAIPGAKPRAILTMLGLHGGSIVPAGTLVELLWGDDPPCTADKALQTHISSLRAAPWATGSW